MNETALITGASSGIGLEIARLFAASGKDLLLVARNSERLEDIRKDFETKYKIRVSVLPLDLSLKESCDRIVSYIEKEKLQIVYLVNNAGFGDFGPFVERNYDKLDNMIALNISALSRLTHVIVGQMLKQGKGRILNVASIAALQPVPQMAVYAATKAYVLSFSQALSYELRKQKLSVTALLPGPTDTAFFERGEGLNSRMRSFSMSPQSVAKTAYRAMLKGRRRVTAGYRNKFLALLSKLFPVNSLLLSISNSIAEEDKNGL